VHAKEKRQRPWGLRTKAIERIVEGMTVDLEHLTKSRLANMGGSEVTLGPVEIRQIAL